MSCLKNSIIFLWLLSILNYCEIKETATDAASFYFMTLRQIKILLPLFADRVYSDFVTVTLLLFLLTLATKSLMSAVNIVLAI